MASIEKIHPDNVTGSLFVDLTCIDCGTCFHLGPSIFGEAPNEKSFVKSQPTCFEEWSEAKRAILSCPTNSIGVSDAPLEFREAAISLPMLIANNVYYCGYTSKNSFGASSYLIERPSGNILIDSPRFNTQLAREITSMGGVKTMILTHIDDVADHEKWHRYFGCERIIEQREVDLDLMGIENKIELKFHFELDDELVLIPAPGHTEGHLLVLYKNEFLFTGDHIFFNKENNSLSSSRSVCWFDWKTQIASTQNLKQFQFEWILPGHGGWGRIDSEKMGPALDDLLQRMNSSI